MHHTQAIGPVALPQSPFDVASVFMPYGALRQRFPPGPKLGVATCRIPVGGGQLR